MDTMWTALSAIATLVLGAISLFLLFQGQSDRRKVYQEKRSEQARGLTITLNTIYNDDSADVTIAEDGTAVRGKAQAFMVLGHVAVIRNDSDMPIFLSSPRSFITPYNRLSWQPGDLSSGLVYLEHEYLDTTTLDPGHRLEVDIAAQNPSGVLVQYTDSNGVDWVRTSDDGRLYERTPHPPARTRFVQVICRSRIIHRALLSPLLWLAQRGFRKSKDIPLSARLVRWLWGRCPIGEYDPWQMPLGAPAGDWPYYLWAEQAQLISAAGMQTSSGTPE